MRVLLVLLLIYPVSPVDLVPDFLPNGGVRPTARLATHCRRGSDPGLVDKCGYPTQSTSGDAISAALRWATTIRQPLPVRVKITKSGSAAGGPVICQAPREAAVIE